MIVTLRTPVGDIVAKQPRAGAVFERYRIDYCCEGDEPLEAACARAVADPAVVLQQIARAASEALVERDWTRASLTELMDHIVSVHHRALRQGLAAFAARLGVPDSGRHPAGDLHGRDVLRARVESLRAQVEAHLSLEEQRVFPAMGRAEQARHGRRPRPWVGRSPLGDDLRRLAGEHRIFDASLRELSAAAARVLAVGSNLPSLPDEIGSFEADVHRHLHLENNILFPRAMAVEALYG